MNYDMLKSWWEGHGHPVVPQHLLAPTWAHRKYAAGCLYLTNSNLGILEWVVSDPSAPRISRAKDVIQVVKDLEVMAWEYGCRALSATVDKHSIKALGRSLGWTIVGQMAWKNLG